MQPLPPPTTATKALPAYPRCDRCGAFLQLGSDYYTFELEGLDSVLACDDCKLDFAMDYVLPVETEEIYAVIGQEVRDGGGKLFSTTYRKIQVPKKEVPQLQPGEQIFIARKRGGVTRYKACEAPDLVWCEYNQELLDSDHITWRPRRCCFKFLIKDADKELLHLQRRRKRIVDALEKYEENKKKEKEKRKAEEEPSTTAPPPAKAQRQ